jgi:hypothetical protein
LAEKKDGKETRKKAGKRASVKTPKRAKTAGAASNKSVSVVPAVNPEAAQMRTSRHLFRRFTAGLLVILSCVLFVGSVYSLYIENTLLDSKVYSDNMREVIKEPVVKKAVSTYAAEELFSALKVQERITAVLPARVKFIGGPASIWLQGMTQQQVEALLGKKQFQDIWVNVNRSTHKTAVSVLRGEPGNITLTDDGSVYVDILPIVKDLALQFTEGTKLNELVSKIPDGADGGALKIDLSKALSVTLPKDFGRIKVVQSEELIQARQAVAWIDMAAKWLPWATLGFFLGALLVSVERRRTLVQIGAGVAIASMLGYLIVEVAVDQALLSIADDMTRQLLSVVTGILLKDLPPIFFAATYAGIVLAALAFIAGQKAVFMRADKWIRSYTGYGTMAELDKHPIIKWISEYTDVVRVAAIFAAFVALLAIGGWWGIGVFAVTLIVVELVLRYLTGWNPFK